MQINSQQGLNLLIEVRKKEKKGAGPIRVLTKVLYMLRFTFQHIVQTLHISFLPGQAKEHGRMWNLTYWICSSLTYRWISKKVPSYYCFIKISLFRGKIKCFLKTKRKTVVRKVGEQGSYRLSKKEQIYSHTTDLKGIKKRERRYPFFHFLGNHPSLTQRSWCDSDNYSK